MAWIVEGNSDTWPVYRDEVAHFAAGEGPAVDLGNQEGLAWIAPASGVVVKGTGFDPDTGDGGFHAGYVVVFEFAFQGKNYRGHWCHGQSLEVSVGDLIKKGGILGHVGHSGTVIPPGITGAHLHFWLEDWIGVWRRIWPTVFLTLLQQEFTMRPIPQILDDLYALAQTLASDQRTMVEKLVVEIKQHIYRDPTQP